MRGIARFLSGELRAGLQKWKRSHFETRFVDSRLRRCSTSRSRENRRDIGGGGKLGFFDAYRNTRQHILT